MGFRFIRSFRFLRYTIAIAIIFYLSPIRLWFEIHIGSLTHKRSEHLERLKPDWKEEALYPRKLTRELKEHLHQYNPSFPTDYEFHLDQSKLNQVEYFNNTKHTMGKYIYQRLQGKKNGFFIECGAYDGLWLSNTVWLERTHNWTGLLVEVDPSQALTLRTRNRKAWVVDTCLATETHPTVMKFTIMENGRTFIPNEVRMAEYHRGTPYLKKCYPLHMLLDAIGVSEVDYFSLDVEGIDLAVLKTIPWHRIKIKLISVEILNGVTDVAIREYLETVGYRRIKHIDSVTDIQMDDVYELKE